MEVNNILLTKDNTIQKLLMSYATNNEKREELLESIIDDPFHIELDYEAGLTRTASIARQFFKCLGIEIYDEELEEETEVEYDEVNKPVQ